jgi:hypothetical protein
MASTADELARLIGQEKTVADVTGASDRSGEVFKPSSDGGGMNAFVGTIPAIIAGIDLINRGSAAKKQRGMDEDFADARMANFQRAMELLLGAKDQITSGFAPLIEGIKPMIDSRLQTAQRTATIAGLRRRADATSTKLSREQAKRGVLKSGRSLGDIQQSEEAFSSAVAQFDAFEQAQGRQLMLQALQAQFGQLAPIISQIAQFQAGQPVPRERALGVVDAGLSDLFGNLV